MSKKLSLQIHILFYVTLANFIAQIPYTIHLYGVAKLFMLSRGFLLMDIVFAMLMIGYIRFMKREWIGYWLLVVFLSLEFLFYLWNFIGSLLHGYGLFFQLFNPDLILTIVFIIGYLNLFASGYFLFLLTFKRKSFPMK